MPTYYDSAKVVYVLDTKLAEGGEGAAWRIQGRSDALAKIYLPSAKTPQAKIAWMIDHPPDDPTVQKRGHTSIAWPRALLLDDKRAFAGYLMPFVRDAVPLLKIYNPALRARLPFSVNRLFLHRTASNLCSAIGALHDKGYVIGDINEGNILVKNTALLSVIDTDSFQVQAQTAKGLQIFHCPVGKEEFTPPELQGKSFANLVRTPHHDSFGLGVIIFLLLMEGMHPFDSHWHGSGDPPAKSEKISRGMFPYSASATTGKAQFGPPRKGPRFDHLHPVLQTIFVDCFETGGKPPYLRPTAEQWERALITAEHALIQCANGHYFSGHLPSCPYCPSSSKGAQVPLKPAPPRPPSPPPARPVSTPGPTRPPAPPVPSSRRFTPKHWLAGGGGVAGLVLAGILIFGGGGGNGTNDTVAQAVVQRTATAAIVQRVAPTRTPKPRPTPAATADPRLGGGCWTAAQLTSSDGATQWSFPPSKVIVAGKTYTATIETSKGTITVELMADQMPVTVNNFVCLARAGYYDDTSFYRITDTAIQGGDPTGTGKGGPGYTIPDEPVVGDYTRGTLAMVNEGPKTTGSRFFLFASDYTGLKRYPIFGHVTAGLDVLDAIAADPADPERIERITISEK